MAVLWYNKLMSKRLVLVMSLVSAIILLVLVNFTTPVGVGPLGVLVFFTTFYVLMFGVALGIVQIFVKLTSKQMGRKQYLYAAVIAFGPIMLMLAQALGSMSLLTVVLTAVFVCLGCFLVSKRA